MAGLFFTQQGVPSSSIYGATLRALARRSFESLEQLRSLNIATVDDETAHEVFAKVRTKNCNKYCKAVKVILYLSCLGFAMCRL